MKKENIEKERKKKEKREKKERKKERKKKGKKEGFACLLGPLAEFGPIVLNIMFK